MKKTIFNLLASLLVLLISLDNAFTQPTSQSPKSSITTVATIRIKDFYRGDDGGAYYVTVDGDNVYWAAEHPGKKYAHVFYGKLKSGNTIEGEWLSVPKYGSTARGAATFKIEDNGNTLKIVRQTGDFPTTPLSFMAMNEKVIQVLPRQKSGEYSASKASDMDGTWIGKGTTRTNDRCYARQVGNTVVMFCESEFAQGEKPQKAYVFVGNQNTSTREVKGKIAFLSKGSYPIGVHSTSFKVTGDEEFRYQDGFKFGSVSWKRIYPEKYKSDINSYVNGLKYDSRQLLAVQGDGAEVPKRKKIGEETSTSTPTNDGVIICKKVKYNLANNVTEVAVLRPLSGVLFPGALVRVNQALVNGTPELVTEIPRAPITMNIDLPGFTNGKGKFTVADPKNSSVQAKITDALHWWNNNAYKDGYYNASQSSYKESVAYSFEQVAIELGVNYKSIGTKISGNFNHTSTSSKKVVTSLFRQVYYTVTVDQPNRPADWFAPSVNVDQVKPHFKSSQPLAYISNVSYGRILLYRMETSSKEDDATIKAAMSYFTGNGAVSGDLKVKYDKILAESSIEILALGGNAQEMSKIVLAKNTREALQNAITNKNALYNKNNPGYPISYTVRFVKGNSLAKMGMTTSFSVTECEEKPNQFVEFEHRGAYVARFYVTWKVGDKQEHWESGSKTAGWEYKLKLPYNATQIWVSGRAQTGLVWQPWNTIFDQAPPESPCRCKFVARGTTLNTKKDISCQ